MRWYVCTKSAWEGDRWTPVAGPWSSREMARYAAEDYERASKDIRMVRYATVMSRSELARRGWPRTIKGDYELEEAIRENHERLLESA